MTVLETIVWEYLWGMPLILISLGVGIYLTLFTGFFQFRFFSHAMAVAWKKLFRKGASGASGTISALEALSLAIGATVGVGNIGGVATAIAVGGPGAVFWKSPWLCITGATGPTAPPLGAPPITSKKASAWKKGGPGWPNSSLLSLFSALA